MRRLAIAGHVEIGGAERHRGAKIGRVADEAQARIVGDVQPFVAVGRPGIGIGETRHQMSAMRERQRPTVPKAPSTWTQAPAGWRGHKFRARGSNAPVFTLPA